MFARVLKRANIASYIARNFSTSDSLQRVPFLSMLYAETGKPTEVLKLMKGYINVDQAKSPSWVLVKQLAAPINPADLNMVRAIERFLWIVIATTLSHTVFCTG
jgi:hypothetical protein